MRDADLPSKLQTRPIPKRESLDDGNTIMRWRLEMLQATTAHQLTGLSERLSNGRFSLCVDLADDRRLSISIVSKPHVSYTDLWDFSSRALLTVETLFGEIVSIESTPRHKWKLQFVAAERCGAFDADKTSIMIAAENGDIAMLRSVLSKPHSLDLDEATPFGLTALGYAASKGHLEIMELLLKAGANPNTSGEVTTLQSGVLGGLETVLLLIQAGADVNRIDKYGETALMSAAAIGKLDIVKELVQNGADPKLEDKRGNTALKRAQRNKRTRVAEFLKQS